MCIALGDIYCQVCEFKLQPSMYKALQSTLGELWTGSAQ